MPMVIRVYNVNKIEKKKRAKQVNSVRVASGR